MKVWKPIYGYEGLYEVSNCGCVRRIAGWDNRNNGYRLPTGELKQSVAKGYLQVCLYKNGVRQRYKVHRLVASAFVENPENLPQVNHKDGNKKNNNVSNLEWVTQSQNNKHARNMGLCPTKTEKMTKARHLVGLATQNILKFNPSKKVIIMTADGEKMFASCHECAKAYGVSASSISYWCKKGGFSKKIGGTLSYGN